MKNLFEMYPVTMWLLVIALVSVLGIIIAGIVLFEQIGKDIEKLENEGGDYPDDF